MTVVTLLLVVGVCAVWYVVILALALGDDVTARGVARYPGRDLEDDKPTEPYDYEKDGGL